MSFQLWKDKEEVLRKNNLLQKNTSMCVSEDFVALLILTLIHYQVRDRRLLKEGDICFQFKSIKHTATPPIELYAKPLVKRCGSIVRS